MKFVFEWPNKSRGLVFKRETRCRQNEFMYLYFKKKHELKSMLSTQSDLMLLYFQVSKRTC